MKSFWVVFTLFIISLTVTGTGVTLLVVRHHVDAPQSYREASINYQDRLAKSKVKVHVAKGDLHEMARRVSHFIRINRGKMTFDGEDTIFERYEFEVPVEAARHLALLHNEGGRGLTPGYKYWDYQRKVAIAPDSTVMEVTVVYKSKRYLKALLDIGIVMTIIGGICSIILLFGSLFELGEAMSKKNLRKEAEANGQASTV